MTKNAAPFAPTRSGNIEGIWHRADKTHSRDVARFCAIPFAEPISGPNRFTAPKREATWSGTRNAAAFGPICPQVASPLTAMFGAVAPVMADDCLTLNVWTPGLDDGKRPVMVWIHGGGYSTGSGSTPWYDGRRFAANHDVVLVTVNYRLGALGYLDTSRLVPGSSDVVTPNNGVLDQIAALEWIRDCIGGFGGDPGSVTVFGESAGAMSIGALLGSPAAKGLFQQAILQSGAASNVSDHTRADQSATAFLRELNVPSTGEGLLALTAIPIDEIIRASGAAERASNANGGLAWQPTIGADSLPVHPLKAVSDGSADGIRILFGTNRDEMRLFLTFDPSTSHITRDWMVSRLAEGMPTETAVTIVDAALAESAGRSVLDTWVDIASDQTFRWPAEALARALSERGTAPMWAYEFTWPTPAFGGVLLCCHALEIPFVFDNLHQAGAAVFTGTTEDTHGVARVFNHTWAHFARHGHPNAGINVLATPWPEWNPEDRMTLIIDREVSLSKAHRSAALDRWSGFSPI